MRPRILVPVLLAALVLSGCSLLGSEDRTLTVTGSGSIRIRPDLVSVTLGIQTRNDDVAQARAGELAGAAGVTLDTIQTLTTNAYSAFPQPYYPGSGLGGGGGSATEVPTQPGTLEVTVQVTVVYNVK